MLSSNAVKRFPLTPTIIFTGRSGTAALKEISNGPIGIEKGKPTTRPKPVGALVIYSPVIETEDGKKNIFSGIAEKWNKGQLLPPFFYP